ncbi:MAG: FmdB family zinc ribbon protein [bacterium]
MPFYEYQCTACSHRLEALRKVSDEPLVYCPECGEASLKRLISRAAFQLKGTGWYETDFKNSGKARKDSSDESKGGESNNAQPNSDASKGGAPDKQSKQGKNDAAKTPSAGAPASD